MPGSPGPANIRAPCLAGNAVDRTAPFGSDRSTTMMSKTPAFVQLDTPLTVRAKQLTGLFEIFYAGVLLFALTQGPVLSYWLRNPHLGQLPPERAIDTTYLFVQLPAVALLIRRLRPGLLAWRPALFVTALAGFMALSTWWSVLRADTIVATAALVTTTLAGLYLAASFSLRRLLWITCLAMQPGLIISEHAVRVEWTGAIDLRYSWTGIYINRNSLGPPAAIGLITALFLAFALLRRTSRHRTLAVVFLLAAAAYDARILHKSGSATSFTLAAVAIFVFVGFTAAAVLLGRRCTPQLARRIGAAYVGVLCGVAIVVYGLRDQVSSWLHRPAGFDGRTPYWEASLHGFRVHPLRGWGWLSAWHSPEFKALVPESLQGELWSHSAYLDVALGGGLIAVCLLAGVFAAGFGNVAEIALADGELAAWPIALATAVAIASTQESFMIGNHFLWLLFVAAVAKVVNPTSTRPTEPQPEELDSQEPAWTS